MEKVQIEQLLHQYIAGTINDSDRRSLAELVIGDSDPEMVVAALHNMLEATEGTPSLVPADWEAIPGTIIAMDRQAGAAVRRIPRKRSWVAASIVLLLAAGTYFQVAQKSKVDPAPIARTIADIVPGTNRAILTVGDQTIQLSNDKTGITVGSTITYDDGERIAEANQHLQVITPRGGQYQAVLPDGTKVWLNAASSISFPSKFNGKKRIVEVTGEVYMEVVQNPDQPFAVIADDAEIQVLGTSFNVNAYENEDALRATLVSGAVKLVVADQGGRYGQGGKLPPAYDEKKFVILKPGQQAIAKAGSVAVHAADLDKVMAWKNGLFDFNGLSFEEIMRQLERWYDIRVDYENTEVLQTKLAGKMTRGVSLTGLLERLEKMGIHYKLENRTLIFLKK